jgi:acetoacetate decarboxylase
MGIRGHLTKENLGFSMPAHAPLYPRPPYDYQDAKLLVFEYLTDPESAARMLPEQAEILPEQPVAGLVFAHYPSGSLGPYQEVVQFLLCVYQGKPVQFATHLYVTTDVAMAAGREMGGYPKKVASIHIHGDDSGPFRASLDRPAGHRLAAASLTVSGEPTPVAPADATLHYLTLRVIPSPTVDAPPSAADLILSDWEIVDGRQWTGTGTLELTGVSGNDPLHFAPVKSVLASKLVRGNLRVTSNPPDPSRLLPF